MAKLCRLVHHQNSFRITLSRSHFPGMEGYIESNNVGISTVKCFRTGVPLFSGADKM